MLLKDQWLYFKLSENTQTVKSKYIMIKLLIFFQYFIEVYKPSIVPYLKSFDNDALRWTAIFLELAGRNEPVLVARDLISNNTYSVSLIEGCSFFSLWNFVDKQCD